MEVETARWYRSSCNTTADITGCSHSKLQRQPWRCNRLVRSADVARHQSFLKSALTRAKLYKKRYIKRLSGQRPCELSSTFRALHNLGEPQTDNCQRLGTRTSQKTNRSHLRRVQVCTTRRPHTLRPDTTLLYHIPTIPRPPAHTDTPAPSSACSDSAGTTNAPARHRRRLAKQLSHVPDHARPLLRTSRGCVTW